jgi:hypothetical protein
MKTPSLFLLALFLLAPAAASARLGETPAECDARYGNPLRNRPSEPTVYLKGGFLITVDFHQGHAYSIVYQQTPGGGEKLEKLSITPEQIQTLLSYNAGPSQWNSPTQAATRTQWIRADKLATASYDSTHGKLSLLLLVESQAAAAAKAAAIQNAIDSF